MVRWLVILHPDLHRSDGRYRRAAVQDQDGPDRGESRANYESGTAAPTFAHRVMEPNASPQSIAVFAQTLELNSGGIQSAGTGVAVHLAHRSWDTTLSTRWTGCIDGTRQKQGRMLACDQGLSEYSVPGDSPLFLMR